MSSTVIVRQDDAPTSHSTLPPFRERLARLRELCAGLADSMDENAAQLETSGVPPAEALLEDLSQFRRQLAHLLSHVRPGETPLHTLTQIEEAFDEGERADRCVAAIDRFLRLRGTEGAAVPQLTAAQLQAADFREQVRAGTAPESLTCDLAESRHPWCDLVSLVTESDSLDDEHWNQLSTSVLGHLGPAIATAAARGRIVLDSAPSSLPATVNCGDAVTESTSIDAAGAEDDDAGKSPQPAAGEARSTPPAWSPEPEFDSVFDDDLPAASSPPPNSDSSADAATDVAEQDVSTSGESASATTIDGGHGRIPASHGRESSQADERTRLHALAKVALGATDPARCAWIAELILELIAAGRPGLAYHLARCLEERRSRVCAPIPSSLIRVWTIGQGVLFPRGELAALLEGDLLDIASRGPIPSDDTWTAALALLTRAAVLRPAVVAPATRATAWLRSLPHHSDAGPDVGRAGSQLYNYCSRVSSDSEKLGGFRMGLVRRGADAATLDRLRQELVADVRRWLAQPPPAPLRYESTTPLFLKAHWTLRAPPSSSDRLRWAEWQRAARAIDAIISDVLADRRQEAPRLRAEMDRIARELLPGLQSVGPDLGEAREAALRDRLLQALSFGQRWLAIGAMPTEEASGFLPQAAEDLLREIRSRHTAVLEELRAFRDRTTSHPVRMAIAILALAIENVRRLVESSDAGGMQEPDPRHLLHAELLKVPSLRLDAAWEPDLDRRHLEEEILRSLAGPEVDWLTAFQTRITIDDRDSAARILSLAHWSGDERNDLQRQLDETRKLRADEDGARTADRDGLVATTEHLQTLSTQEHAGLLTRLERLRSMLQADLDAVPPPSTRAVAPTPARVTPPPQPKSQPEEQGSAFVFD